MSVPISSMNNNASSTPVDQIEETKTGSVGSPDTLPSVAKVHSLGIILIGQLILPLFLIGVGYVAGKQLSLFLKSQDAVAYTPLMAKIKNLTTTAVGGIGLNLGLMCFRQANSALSQSHTLSQFLIDDLLVPSLNKGYSLLANPANMKYLISGQDSTANGN